MRKLSIILLLFFLLPAAGIASHITGGEMFYTYGGLFGGLHRYHVVLKLYQRCNSGRQFPDPAIISVFDKTNNNRVIDIYANIGTQETISITDPDPCITNPPLVCYEVAYYNFTVNLPSSLSGYVVASQVNFRINGINNLQPGYSNIGALYTADIPGNGYSNTDLVNTSAFFTGSDLVIVCANNDFRYSFAAFDPDGDQLRYSFCSAYASTGGFGGGGGGGGGGGVNGTPPDPPPFPEVPYNNPGFSNSQPFGVNVQIDPNNGLLTGIAPDAGIYVVTVCVQEIRGGRTIATQRKDIQINVGDCNIAAASLKPEYLLCKNTQTITLANQSNSPLIVSTNWELKDENNNIVFSSAEPVITYTFPAPGVYTVKLVINRLQTCSDSTSSVIRVFPGFQPGFTTAGICIHYPTFFTDQTSSVYGVPDSWQWDFGESSLSTDVSDIQNPVFTYPQTGTKQVRLIVTDTRGCRDTALKTISIADKPPIGLAFRDTLICLNDVLLLQASGSGVFNWSPVLNMTNPNTATPAVAPVSTTRYYVTLTEGNCINTDSVLVRVVTEVSLQVMNDTTICRGDTIRLHIVSDGLQYQWTPGAQVLNPQVMNPLVITNTRTTYQVTARIGGCVAVKSVVVSPVPYPQVNAGADQWICYNSTTRLNGNTDGSQWSWQPAAFLDNATLLNPVAAPPRSTVFILTATDNRGCPKPASDSTRIMVEPPLKLVITADTAVVTGQPLQLNATGAAGYLWSPPDHLSATTIADPVAIFPVETAGFLYKLVGTSEAGCTDSTGIMVRVYKTLPTVFVPSGFTPNNDGKNDWLLPVVAGMRQLDYFNVYNRWGQLVFSTRRSGEGWDGKINGQLQATATYIWTVKAIDYRGNPYFGKGISTLIR
ncbi:MAG: gliding motility-associated C-terminal domain-containing protein [Sphingobacteriales bacterium]|nr:gliding motility-associated C-terminal domain-containing protein [Sphingobacteriales bacterium]